MFHSGLLADAGSNVNRIDCKQKVLAPHNRVGLGLKTSSHRCRHDHSPRCPARRLEMPIAESRIDFVLSRLPDNSFVKNFVNTFKQYTESHTGYLTQAAFACLTQIAPTKLMTASGTVPILFFMSVGQSGTSRKSTAWSFVRRIFDPHETGYSASVAQTSSKLMEARIAYEPGSPESLVDSLEEYPRQLLIYGEGGNFLGTTQEGYMSAMRSRLNDLWDGGDVYRE